MVKKKVQGTRPVQLSYISVIGMHIWEIKLEIPFTQNEIM